MIDPKAEILTVYRWAPEGYVLVLSVTSVHWTVVSE
jgi:hypothetical protein